ncbi:MAG TPA: alpha-1,4-glucan--maltose-1-phosphate maltosyltransferase [Bacteroidia bacterium]|nr:alpha-1,4-glucan--maltose-1-phosphate maltosyltransferase [Bacteroidia bacterium]
MINPNGRKRVVIANVSPQVDGGRYPAKGAVDELLVISADVFGDGHDEVKAAVLIKHKKERKWREFPMVFMQNDRWEFDFEATKLGFYQFQVLGWVDHFETWRKGLEKKYAAGQDITVELQIGAGLVEQAAKKATEGDKGLLQQWQQALVESGPKGGYEAAQSEELITLMYNQRDEDTVTMFPLVLEIEIERKKASYSTWYELFPRSASSEPGRHGTFNDVKKILPRIAQMGFDVVYFPPIHPIGFTKRKGKNNSLTAEKDDPGSPWAIGSKEGGHKAIHPELGTMKDFQSLIKEAGKHGIEIALDIAFQCSPDHPYVKDHPRWFKWRPDGTVQYAENPPKKYEDILPFDFESDDWQGLWRELHSVIEFWVEKGITIFRVDNPHTKALRFWEWVIPQIRSKNPEVIFLAEAFTRPRIMEQLGKAGFNQSYTYFTWRHTKQEFVQYLTELTQTPVKDYFRPNFWPNTPDILPPILTHGGETAHILRLILAATMSSSYGIYGPVYEFGINTPHGAKEEYTDNEKYELKHWDWNADTRIREVITRVNRIRKENTALQSTSNILFAETSNEHILCYCKQDRRNGNTLIIAVNLDLYNVQGAQVKLPLEKLGMDLTTPFKVHDLLSGDVYQWQGEWNYVQLAPWEMPAHILRIMP